jgi:hypothetical protein
MATFHRAIKCEQVNQSLTRVNPLHLFIKSDFAKHASYTDPLFLLIADTVTNAFRILIIIAS